MEIDPTIGLNHMGGVGVLGRVVNGRLIQSSFPTLAQQVALAKLGRREFTVRPNTCSGGSGTVLVSDGTILGQKADNITDRDLQLSVSNGDSVYVSIALDETGAVLNRTVMAGEMPADDPAGGLFYYKLADVTVTDRVSVTQSAWGPLPHFAANANPDIDPDPGGGITNARLFAQPGFRPDSLFAARTFHSPNKRIRLEEDAGNNCINIIGNAGTIDSLYELTWEADSTSPASDYWLNGEVYIGGVVDGTYDSVSWYGPRIILVENETPATISVDGGGGGSITVPSFKIKYFTRPIWVNSMGFVYYIGPEYDTTVTMTEGSGLLGY